MAKRKKSKKKKSTKRSSSRFLSYMAWALALIALALTSLLIGYYIGFKKAEKKENIVEKTAKEVPKKAPKKSVNKRLSEVLKKESKNYTSAAHEIESEALVNPPKKELVKPKVYVCKPKLAIVIDDVATRSQVKAIKSLHLPLNMSFFPPSKRHPNSAKLAAKESFYMVHLPMEAMHFNKEEAFTLHVGDSQAVIQKRVDDIKRLFPKVHYINNHTGSKFTADETAMNRLIFAFNKDNILFVDSRTTAKTQAPKVLKNFGLKYVARDIFLDHHTDKAYIKGQIKKAVALAKKRGYAIAIGHPHKNTLEALRESKALFSDVDLVLMNKIY